GRSRAAAARNAPLAAVFRGRQPSFYVERLSPFRPHELALRSSRRASAEPDEGDPLRRPETCDLLGGSLSTNESDRPPRAETLARRFRDRARVAAARPHGRLAHTGGRVDGNQHRTAPPRTSVVAARARCVCSHRRAVLPVIHERKRTERRDL